MFRTKHETDFLRHTEVSEMKALIENLRAEVLNALSAADRNSVKLHKVTRQNKEYCDFE